MRSCNEACYTAPSGRVIDLPPIGQMMENAFIVRGSTPVEAPPVRGKTRFAVWKEDTADAGRRLLDAGLSPAILNLADELTPGGGVRKGSQAQEESLCRRSTLLVSLSQFHPEYAPKDGIPFVAEAVVFAILEGRKTTPAPHAPEGNFLPFQRVFVP